MDQEEAELQHGGAAALIQTNQRQTKLEEPGGVVPAERVEGRMILAD
jgi:hypothetical protein